MIEEVKSDMEELKFKCPKCGETVLEEMMTGVTVYNTINSIHCGAESGVGIDWGDDDYEDGRIDRFQCLGCNYTLEDKNGMLIRSYETLVEWLKDPFDWMQTLDLDTGGK